MTVEPWLALMTIPLAVVIAFGALLALPNPAPPIELPPEPDLGVDDPDPLTRRLRADSARRVPGGRRSAR